MSWCAELQNESDEFIFLITGKAESNTKFATTLETSLNEGVKLVQFRQHNLDQYDLIQRLMVAINLCESYSAKLFFNGNIGLAVELGCYGVHLSSSELKRAAESKVVLPNILSYGASCHNLLELQQAEQLKTDYVFLSPVLSTNSHPGAKTLGWSKFFELSNSTKLPVYALGGMSVSDLATAKKHSGCGIAAISSLWKV